MDRESSQSYHFSVDAFDQGGVNTLSSKVPVVIDILDANDNDPKFIRKEYRVSVSELAALGSTVIRVKAIDSDEGSQLRYEIVGGNSRNR